MVTTGSRLSFLSRVGWARQPGPELGDQPGRPRRAGALWYPGCACSARLSRSPCVAPATSHCTFAARGLQWAGTWPRAALCCRRARGFRKRGPGAAAPASAPDAPLGRFPPTAQVPRRPWASAPGPPLTAHVPHAHSQTQHTYTQHTRAHTDTPTHNTCNTPIHTLPPTATQHTLTTHLHTTHMLTNTDTIHPHTLIHNTHNTHTYAHTHRYNTYLHTHRHNTLMCSH